MIDWIERYVASVANVCRGWWAWKTEKSFYDMSKARVMVCSEEGRSFDG